VKAYGGYARAAGRAATFAQRIAIASHKFTGVRRCAAKHDVLSPWWLSCGCFV
jgi:hypothetical protein